MPRKNAKSVTRKVRSLTHQEYMDLLLADTWSPPPGGAFPTPEARRAAWELNRDRMIRPGSARRPGAWWQYDSPGQRLELGQSPGYDFPIMESQHVALVRLGEATPEEVQLFRDWHQNDFDRSDLEQYFKWFPGRKIEYEHEREVLAEIGQ